MKALATTAFRPFLSSRPTASATPSSLRFSANLAKIKTRLQAEQKAAQSAETTAARIARQTQKQALFKVLADLPVGKDSRSTIRVKDCLVYMAITDPGFFKISNLAEGLKDFNKTTLEFAFNAFKGEGYLDKFKAMEDEGRPDKDCESLYALTTEGLSLFKAVYPRQKFPAHRLYAFNQLEAMVIVP
jgi:hypothetical protein